MKRIADKLNVFLLIVVASLHAAACPLCRAQVKDGVYNADFFGNFVLVLLPVAILTAFGIGLSRAENIRAWWEKMR